MTIDLKAHIRHVPDFPKAGILFYDIGTLLADGQALKYAIEKMSELVKKDAPDLLVAVESRGFLLAAPIAAMLGIGLVMVRKKGKLPGKTAAYTYSLEYGQDTIEIQEGIVPAGKKAILIDDVLATGGTATASLALARKVGIDVVKAAFLIELTFLSGRKAIDIPVESLLAYES